MGTDLPGTGGGAPAIDDATLIDIDTAALLTATSDGALDSPVAACPGWDVARLCGHLGWVHRWATQVVRTGLEPERDAVPKPPRDREEAVAWLAEGVAPLVDAIRTTDPARPSWNRWDGPATTSFWARRQAIETALHRWDVEAAVGRPGPIDPDLAAAGVEELLTVHLPFALRQEPVPFTGSVHLHATDRESEWTITGDGASVTAEPGHRKGDAAVQVSASDLLLLLWRRIEPDDPRLTTFGDVAALQSWLAAGVPR